jgi:hypothetical protein
VHTVDYALVLHDNGQDVKPASRSETALAANVKMLLHRKNLAILVLLLIWLSLPLLGQELVLRGRVTGRQGHGLPILRFSSSVTIPGQRVGY